MLIAYLCISKSSSMTDSMKFGPEWLRTLSSEVSTAPAGTKYQLAGFRYGREEMLALFEKGLRAPESLSSFNPLYSEQVLPPLALLPPDDERSWASRSAQPGNTVRGRGTASLDRGGRGGGRGRASFQSYNRSSYDSSGGWTGTENTNEWSPRKEYTRASSVDNWRRHRNGDEDEGWRSGNHTRIPPEKWVRSPSWREGDGNEERSNRTSWPEVIRAPPQRQSMETEEIPEWVTESSLQLRGSFDSSGAFHGCSDDEQREHKPIKKDTPLQKSISQQNITVKCHPHTLPSSQSAVSLSKPPDDNILNDINQQETTKKDTKLIEEKQKTPPEIEQTSKHSKPTEYNDDPPKLQNTPQKEPNEYKQHFHTSRIFNSENKIDVNGIHSPDSNNRVDEEFERSQEDFVKKLVVDEEMPKKPLDNFMLSTVVPPPNITPPTQDSWCYQDPQGDLQGPFPSSEMAEWFRAGYFTSALLVKRHCDESYYRLGDLVTKCGGNPFQSNIRIAPLKQEIVPPVTDELLKYQLLQRQLLRQQAETIRVLSQNETPWTMSQQRDLISQQVLTHPQMTSDMQFFQQQQQQPQPQPVTNPLMNMINQMQQASKLPSQILGKKPTQLDPIQALVQQMGGLQSLQNTGTNSSGLPTNIPTSLQNSGLLNNFSNLSTSLNTGSAPVGFSGLNSSGLHNTSSILSTNETINSNGLSVGLAPGLHDGNRLPPRPNPLSTVDSISSTNENDPLKNLLQQLQSKQQTQQLDSLWQQSQFTSTPTNMQWQPNEVPISMWDLQPPPVTTALTNTASIEKLPPTQTPQQSLQTNQIKNQEKERQRLLKENLEKEQRRQKEIEEKQAKKEAEEKRKEEQRRQEAEKKMAEEKRRKEEERVRRELEKAKKEAEEKRLRELEEKRRLKEQRKAEEEAKRKMEEQKKLEEAERVKNELKEKEEQFRMKQMEAALQRQQQQEIDLSHKAAQRIAPWSQSNLTPELSLTEIQRAEREKRAEQVAIQQQRAQLIQQELSAMEKQVMQLNWSKKPTDSKSIKSLVEIQQEEQERLAKQTSELRAALKEKEILAPTPVTASVTPWSGHGLSWSSSNQWNNNIGGFWDDTNILTHNKPSALTKSSSATVVKQAVKQNKHKLKKEEQQVMKLFSNGPITDEFTEWCIATLTRLNSTVDIPTFINFLRDIESALEVKDYCKEYFGDVPATQHFVTQFLEKRRVFKPRVVTQTDDMSSPAPALTPSMQHNIEFQEVKGKAKKCKKSKMIKVDARNLGFSVTAAPDRINVGDRDYVEN